MSTISVNDAVARILGLDPLRTNDIYQEAPEPSPPGFGGLRPTNANLLYLWEQLPDAGWQDPGNRLLEARTQRFIGAQRRAGVTDDDRAWPFRVEPKPYQLEIFAAARRMPYAALAPVAPGTGKTKMAMDISASLWIDGEVDGAAVIAAPKGVPRQWVNEALPQHMSLKAPYLAVQWSPTRRTDSALMRKSSRMRWITFNVEAFSTESGKAAKALEAFLKSGRMVLIWDESSRGKNPRAIRTKTILKLAPLAARRMILSGTPITKGIEDLWSQYQFLDPGIIGMSNYWAFRRRYCVLAPAYRGAPPGAEKIVGYRNMEEFVRKIAPSTFVVPKSVLGLPPKTYERLPVELTPEQASTYRAMAKRLVEDLRASRIASPANAAVRLLRLQQVLSGRVYVEAEDRDEPPYPTTIPSNRVPTLIEHITEGDGDPNVIWCRFTADILDVVAALKAAGRRPVSYYGATSDDDRERAKKAFMSGDASDFVGNPSTAGMGLDGLQTVCQRSYWYSNSFNREHRWQGEDRIQRLGMLGTALNIDLVAPGTVDEMILGSYAATEDLIRSLIDRPELIPVG